MGLPHLQVFQQLLQGPCCDQAKIRGAGHWAPSLGLKLLPSLVQVELLLAKTQSFAISLFPREKAKVRETSWAGNLQHPLPRAVLETPGTRLSPPNSGLCWGSPKTDHCKAPVVFIEMWSDPRRSHSHKQGFQKECRFSGPGTLHPATQPMARLALQWGQD